MWKQLALHMTQIATVWCKLFILVRHSHVVCVFSSIFAMFIYQIFSFLLYCFGVTIIKKNHFCVIIITFWCWTSLLSVVCMSLIYQILSFLLHCFGVIVIQSLCGCHKTIIFCCWISLLSVVWMYDCMIGWYGIQWFRMFRSKELQPSAR